MVAGLRVVVVLSVVVRVIVAVCVVVIVAVCVVVAVEVVVELTVRGSTQRAPMNPLNLVGATSRSNMGLPLNSESKNRGLSSTG